MAKKSQKHILWFNEINLKDVPLVGGKNASLGEMIRYISKKGIDVPNGFATTARAYFYFLEKAGLKKKIKDILKDLNVTNLKNLQEKGREVRKLILESSLPKDLEKGIIKAYRNLSRKYGEEAADVAVRSSATAEDLPSISEDEHVLVRINGDFVYNKIGEIYNQIGNGEYAKIEVPAMKNNEIIWAEAEQIYRHKANSDKLYKIETQSGREITLSPNHSLIVMNRDTLNPQIISVDSLKNIDLVPVINNLPIVKEKVKVINVLDYIKGNDIIETNGEIKIRNCSSNWSIQKGLPSQISVDENFAYFLGLFAAEGSTFDNNTVIITNSDKEVLAKIIKFLKSLNLYNNQKINRYSLRFYCKTLVRFLHYTLGKPLNKKGKGKTCAIKKVPNFIFGYDNKIIGHFLRGCFDGDGCISSDRISYSSSSKMLVGGIIKLLEILGIGFYLKKKPPYYEIYIPIYESEKFKEKIGFTGVKKSKRLNRLINDFKKRKLYPKFRDVVFVSEKFSESLRKKIEFNLPKEKVVISICPVCNQKINKTSYYDKKVRYYCYNCKKAFYENQINKQKKEIYINYDGKGCFLPRGIPWNKGRVEGRFTKPQFKKIIDRYNLKKADFLNFLNGDSVKWDQIKKITPIDYSGWVYDFSVPKIENFAAGIGGIITHNTASFAGQQESFLNIRGERQLLEAVKKCIASLFTDRAIAYREEMRFNHLKIGLSVGIQKMIRADLGASGVMFSCDTESGFGNVVLINAGYGLGENIVKGRIDPDQYYVFETTLKKGFKPILEKRMGNKLVKLVYNKNPQKPTKNILVPLKDRQKFVLNDNEILTLSKWSIIIEEHYKKSMDTEWAKDGRDGKLYIVQSRPETIQSRKDINFLEEYVLDKAKAKKVLVTGLSIGSKIGQGKVNRIMDAKDIKKFKRGEILVTDMTDPDWVVAMKLASAIVTDSGGRTAHAAIVSRELGVPCVVGTGNATRVLKTGENITVSCAEGETGKVYQGIIPFKIEKTNISKLKKPKVKIMMNLGEPDQAFGASFIPNDGVGLAREEFIIANNIKIHPLALLNYKKLSPVLKNKIDKLTLGYTDKTEFFVNKLAQGIGKIAAAFYPKEVIVRFSDFKTNEYRSLIGGEIYEPKEENPMIGWRGASRYYDSKFAPAFVLECQAIKKVRKEFGLDNITVMVPFCRTPEEGKKVLDIMEKNGLKKGKDNLKVYVMCEIPSNIILAEEFLEIFDGMSIGSNDLTQLVLGLDRDNYQIALIGDERNEAVKETIRKVIKVCKERKKYCGICGQAPSDFPEFAQFLVEEGIKSISLNPDTIIKTILKITKN